ncbi:hypothetical protein ACFLV5_05435 [Chloroflexota bacterium]
MSLLLHLPTFSEDRAHHFNVFLNLVLVSGSFTVPEVSRLPPAPPVSTLLFWMTGVLVPSTVTVLEDG